MEKPRAHHCRLTGSSRMHEAVYVELAAASNFSFLHQLFREKCVAVFQPEMRKETPRTSLPLDREQPDA